MDTLFNQISEQIERFQVFRSSSTPLLYKITNPHFQVTAFSYIFHANECPFRLQFHLHNSWASQNFLSLLVVMINKHV
ncbi:hypothetical protein F8M41_014854 [Gigaspora margarita]|uniref:Uncharacterized protein n=1 Tax=Gigaspora margarita TaxID=4874 RepID=A0A8H4ENL1_GIGMA|nr:hypothetical protein F8M41_014854 [Gigaspora margarita]